MGRFTLPGAEPRTGRIRTTWHVLLTCCLLAAAPAGLLAQGADADLIHYINYRTFRIPLKDIDPRIVEMRLYVSTDEGRKYQFVPQEMRSDRKFFFAAPSDGKYFFIVQTREANGAPTPPDFRDVAPNLRVIVDTKKPVITRLEQATPKDGYPVAIQWVIDDENFDDVRADYQSAKGGDWYPLPLPRTATGRYDWTPAIPGPLVLRMQAIDKAKHAAEPKDVPITPDPRRASMTPPAGADPSDVKHVKTRRFQLNYELDDDTVGPSNVKSVDIWKRRKDGSWQKCQETGMPRGSVDIQVDSPGLWGFRLIPRSGANKADPDPGPSDAPDVWVEVDESAPHVQIIGVHVADQGVDAGNVTISWSASDANLTARPIGLFYSLDQKDWKPLTPEPLPNSGNYTFRPASLDPPNLYQFYVKVQAVDEAGNKGEDKWLKPVMVDLKIPRIKKQRIEVRPGDGAAQTQGMSSSRPSVSVTPARAEPKVPSLPGDELQSGNWQKPKP